MLKLVACVVLVVAVLALPVVHEKPKMRLVEWSENSREWMSEQQIARLANMEGTKVGFIDVTDTFNGTTTSSRGTFPALPTELRQQAFVHGVIDGGLEKSRVNDSIAYLSSFHNRYYTTDDAESAVTWLKKQYMDASAGRSDIHFELFQHSFTQNSLIVTIEGSGEHSKETVILGGHIDSIAGGASSISPGADDDASGSSTVLEVFTALVSAGFQPDRTVEFHAYAAEEVGLRGSQDIAMQYAREGREVVSMVQFDMTGYPYPEVGEKAQIGLITDFVDKDMTDFVRKLIAAYCAIGSQDSKCGYGCSDHASWTKNGYRSSFPFESVFEHHNPYIHTPSDTMANVELDHVMEFVKLGVGYIAEAALV